MSAGQKYWQVEIDEAGVFSPDPAVDPETALLIAVERDLPELTRAALGHGAELAKDRESPESAATFNRIAGCVQRGSWRALRVLLDAGADPFGDFLSRPLLARAEELGGGPGRSTPASRSLAAQEFRDHLRIDAPWRRPPARASRYGLVDPDQFDDELIELSRLAAIGSIEQLSKQLETCTNLAGDYFADSVGAPMSGDVRLPESRHRPSCLDVAILSGQRDAAIFLTREMPHSDQKLVRGCIAALTVGDIPVLARISDQIDIRSGWNSLSRSALVSLQAMEDIAHMARDHRHEIATEMLAGRGAGLSLILQKAGVDVDELLAATTSRAAATEKLKSRGMKP